MLLPYRSSRHSNVNVSRDRSGETLSYVLVRSAISMRSIGPKPFNAKRLGEDLPGLELTDSETPLNVVVLQ